MKKPQFTKKLAKMLQGASCGPAKHRQDVVDAEEKFGYFISEHHLAFALADHCSKLFPTLFPDSEIATRFKNDVPRQQLKSKSLDRK